MWSSNVVASEHWRRNKAAAELRGAYCYGRFIRKRTAAQLRAAECRIRKRTPAELLRRHYIRPCLPYGIWHCGDGREVLFDRDYAPICQRYPGHPATMANPAEWVDREQEECFYNDGTPEKEKARVAMAVLEQWGMVQAVFDAIKELAVEQNAAEQRYALGKD